MSNLSRLHANTLWMKTASVFEEAASGLIWQSTAFTELAKKFHWKFEHLSMLIADK